MLVSVEDVKHRIIVTHIQTHFSEILGVPCPLVFFLGICCLETANCTSISQQKISFRQLAFNFHGQNNMSQPIYPS